MGNDVRKLLYLVDRHPVQPINKNAIEYLVFGAGSVRGIAHVQAYFTLLEMGPALKLKGVAGISAGALMAIAVFLKLTPEEMRQILNSAFLDKLTKGLKLEHNCGRWSILDMTPMKEMLVQALSLRGLSPSLAFSQIENFDVRVFATDIQTNKLVEFSFRNTPTANVIDSVLASCAMPLVFAPVSWRSRCLVDGAVLEHFPFRTFALSHTLGLFLYDKHRDTTEDSFFAGLKEEEKDHIISIDVSMVGSLEMNPTNEQIAWLKNQGDRAVKNYFGILA